MADFQRGAEQHPHHRRSGQREELRGHVRGPAARSVSGGPEEGQRLRRLLRFCPVHRLLDQLRLLQVRRVPGATGGASFQLGVQVRDPVRKGEGGPSPVGRMDELRFAGFYWQGHLRHRDQRHGPRQSVFLHARLRQGQDLSSALLPAAGPRPSDQRLQRQGRQMGLRRLCACLLYRRADSFYISHVAGKKDCMIIIHKHTK